MSKKAQRRYARQMRKYQALRRKRGTWQGMRDDMIAAFGRIIRGSLPWHTRRNEARGPRPGVILIDDPWGDFK